MWIADCRNSRLIRELATLRKLRAANRAEIEKIEKEMERLKNVDT